MKIFCRTETGQIQGNFFLTHFSKSWCYQIPNTYLLDHFSMISYTIFFFTLPMLMLSPAFIPVFRWFALLTAPYNRPEILFYGTVLSLRRTAKTLNSGSRMWILEVFTKWWMSYSNSSLPNILICSLKNPMPFNGSALIYPFQSCWPPLFSWVFNVNWLGQSP